MRYQFRFALLTYAQCADLDPWKIVELLGTHHGECIIGRECHSDGGTHLHAFVEFQPKFNSRNPRVFDVDGYHPNVSPSKGRPWEGFDYAIKDGDVVAGGLERPKQPTDSRAQSRARIEEQKHVLDAETKEEFHRRLTDVDPSAYWRAYSSVSSYANHRYMADVNAYTTPEGLEFDIRGVEDLSNWVQRYLRGHTRGGKCTVVTPAAGRS